MKFNFLGIFFKFFGAQMVKMASFLIQATSFEFKLKMWANQHSTPHYRPLTPAVVGTDRPGQSVQLQVTRTGTSAGPGGNYRRWNQPNAVELKIRTIHDCRDCA
jgi:hypothetical protein